jgi:hypothetical protein
VTGKEVTYQQVGLREVGGNLTEEMKEELEESVDSMNEYTYFGPTGRKDLEWTLEQMDERPGTWEEFVRKHEPWF